MKILIYTFPYHGHTMQAIQIANYLSEQSNHVTIDVHPSYFDYLLPSVNKTECLYTYLKKSDSLEGERLFNYAEGVLLTTQKYLDNFKQNSEVVDLILFDSLAYWGYSIAEKYNIDSISLMTMQPFVSENFMDCGYKYLGLYSNSSTSNTDFLRHIYIYQTLVKKKYDLPEHFLFEDLLCAKGDINFVLLPKSLCCFAEDLSDAYCLYSPIIDFPPKTKGKKRAVYISTGSIISDINFINLCISVLINTGIELYVSSGEYTTELQERYNNYHSLHFYEFAPQLELLDKCSVFITHGGSNSICEAIYFETPMIVIPFVNDEFLNADMVVKNGFGLVIENNPIEIRRHLREYVLNILNDTIYQNRLEQVSAEMDINKSLNIINQIIIGRKK